MLGSAIVCLVAIRAWSYPETARETKLPCASCHTNIAGGAELNDPGKAFLADNAKKPETIATKTDYVGSAKCKMCHMKQHKAWGETAHAKAHSNLAAADDKVVAEWAAKLKIELTGSAVATEACVRCHVTGFQLGGGYPAADSLKTVAVSAVGCESCHGPGAKHVTAPAAQKKKYITKSITQKMCVQCHTPEINPEFDFAAMKKTGVHTVAAAPAK
jgi:hypothetical protein